MQESRRRNLAIAGVIALLVVGVIGGKLGDLIPDWFVKGYAIPLIAALAAGAILATPPTGKRAKWEWPTIMTLIIIAGGLGAYAAMGTSSQEPCAARSAGITAGLCLPPPTTAPPTTAPPTIAPPTTAPPTTSPPTPRPTSSPTTPIITEFRSGDTYIIPWGPGDNSIDLDNDASATDIKLSNGSGDFLLTASPGVKLALISPSAPMAYASCDGVTWMTQIDSLDLDPLPNQNNAVKAKVCVLTDAGRRALLNFYEGRDLTIADNSFHFTFAVWERLG